MRYLTTALITARAITTAESCELTVRSFRLISDTEQQCAIGIFHLRYVTKLFLVRAYRKVSDLNTNTET